MPISKCRRSSLPQKEARRLRTRNSTPALNVSPVRAPDRQNCADTQRICLDPDNVQKGLAKLVLTIIELLRQLLERQAVRRMEKDSLTEAQLERLGQTFINLEEKVAQMKEYFELSEEDLNIHLGPLGDLL